MLRDFAKRLYTDSTKQNQQIAEQTQFQGGGHGELTDVRLHLDQPIYGEVNGEPVTIVGQGNMRGFSPASWCIDGQHENAWLPTGVILITDPRFQPVGSMSTTRSRQPLGELVTR